MHGKRKPVGDGFGLVNPESLFAWREPFSHRILFVFQFVCVWTFLSSVSVPFEFLFYFYLNNNCEILSIVVVVIEEIEGVCAVRQWVIWNEYMCGQRVRETNIEIVGQIAYGAIRCDFVSLTLISTNTHPPCPIHHSINKMAAVHLREWWFYSVKN